MPPPVPLLPSFHTTSLVIVVPLTEMAVPPQPAAQGLEAGKSTCASPSVTPSVARLSPAATNTETPTVEASWSVVFMLWIDCCVQLDSALPQLIDSTLGVLLVSCTAALIASMKPASVL